MVHERPGFETEATLVALADDLCPELDRGECILIGYAGPLSDFWYNLLWDHPGALGWKGFWAGGGGTVLLQFQYNLEGNHCKVGGGLLLDAVPSELCCVANFNLVTCCLPSTWNHWEWLLEGLKVSTDDT